VLPSTRLDTPNGWSRSENSSRTSGAASRVSEPDSRQNTSPICCTYGILDRVPEEECTGPLEGARAPIRIWLRTAPDEVTEGLGMFALLSKELEYYQAHPDSPHVDYPEHDAMLEDGWVLD